jgi:membrane-associated phospholipid phosphatase
MARRTPAPQPAPWERASVAVLTAPSRPPAGTHRAPARGLRAVALAAAFLYLAGISAYLLTHGGWPTPDYLIPPLLLLALALGRGWPFVLDWGPFLVLVLSWQATAGLADELGRPVQLDPLIHADRWLFGGRLPTIELQERLFDPASAHWYDWAATVQHALHFVLPVAVGLAIWLRSRRRYWRYLASVLVLFYLGFIGYALFPAAPPWMAGMLGTTDPVHRVAVETVLRLPASAPIGLAYTHFSYNQVAAMPSLHAALPLLLVLVLIRLWGWWALPVLLYPLTMGFNLVYLGEHWAVDVLAGYAVALVAFLLVWILPDYVPRRRPWPRSVLVPGRRVLPAAPRPAPVGVGSARRAWPAAVRRLAGNATLAAVAVASIAVIAATLRPNRPRDSAGPVVPGLQVQAGQASVLAPVPCAEGGSPSLTAGTILLPITGRYAVYLFDLEDGACYSLSANASFAAPRGDRIAALVNRAPVRLARLIRPRNGVEVYALRTGGPAAALVEAGLPADHRYLLVVLLADVPDLEAAALAVDELTALTLVEDPPVGEPEPPLAPTQGTLPPPDPPTVIPYEGPDLPPPAWEATPDRMPAP